jgi:acetaldehyde dehydrogenase (acetylating)
MIKAGIIGTGNIGTDLLLKILKTDFIDLVIFSGRRLSSDGMKIAKMNNIRITDSGIDFFINNPKYCDVVYDCTNALDAIKHAKIFESQNIKVIDLTPAKVGSFCVPSVNLPKNEININMITCGGQASIPLLNSISKHCEELSYIEVVSQIASDSAGMATRLNIDNYIDTTENAIFQFTDVKKCKVILNLNPAIPQVNMQTTMFIKAKSFDFEPIIRSVYEKIKELKNYIPYYELVMPPTINNDILVLSVKVEGSGDYLPSYAGNLDIINCAAIEMTNKIYE